MNDTLQSDALELADLDRRMVKAVVESDTDALADLVEKYADTRKRIKRQLLESPTPKIHDRKALEVLQNMSEGRALQADKIIAKLQKILGVKGDLTALDEKELDSLVMELFYSWFDERDYIRGLYKIGSLVLSISTPPHLWTFVDEVKNCYAFQQFNAVHSLCRTILESAVRDVIARKKLIKPRQGNVVPIEEYRWRDIKDAVSKGDLRRQIGGLYTDLSSLIHGRKVASGKEAKEAFEATLKAVHALYAYHGL